MPTWLITLDRHFPIRYLTLLAAGAALLAGRAQAHQPVALALAEPGQQAGQQGRAGS